MAVAGAPHFDAALLAALEAETPRELQILRLRLRFGLPQTLVIGQRFRVVLELVDEMGQPVDLDEARRRELEIHATSDPVSSSTSAAEVEIRPRDALTRSSAQQERKNCTWTFDAAFNCQSVVSTSSEGQGAPSARAAILFQLRKRLRGEEALATTFHVAFQRFCVHSVWIDATTLVLPLRTLQIHLTASEAGSSSPKRSNVCTRLFSIPSQTRHDATLIEIEENYGDTMGSHVWDASLLLSFALCVARSSHLRPSIGILELGAGCGLFGVVYAMLSEQHGDARWRSLVLTERAESLSLLDANLARNGVHSSRHEVVVTLPLVWGTPIEQELPPVDAVFACDVLYNWNAHEALLATVEALQAHTTPSEPPASVIIAHKHRGKATCPRLEAVLRGDGANSCGVACRWKNWCVTRAARLGAIDVLVLIRKPGDERTGNLGIQLDPVTNSPVI